MPIKFWIAVVALTCLAIWLLRFVDRRNSVQVYTPQDDEKHQALLKPYLRREIVESKVRSLFPNQDHAKHLAQLHDFVKEKGGNLDPEQTQAVIAHKQKHEALQYGIDHGIIPDPKQQSAPGMVAGPGNPMANGQSQQAIPAMA